MSLYKNITGQSFLFVLFHYTFFLIIYTDVYIYIYVQVSQLKQFELF